MTGRLAVVATPIGNLDDLSPRALRTLAEADVIVCEDTRRTRALLSSAGVATPAMLAANDHSEASQIEAVLAHLADGELVALVSDAGVPAISDPGERTVAAAAAAGFEVTVVPGPSAGISALAVSGLPTGRYVFEGFLPRRGSARSERLDVLAQEQRTMVLYEAPHRLARTLSDLVVSLGEDRRVAMSRELTKRFEETRRGVLGEALQHLDEHPARGEYVLVVDGCPAPEAVGDQAILEALDRLRAEGTSTRDAVSEIASSFAVPKRRVYDLALHQR